MYLITARLLVFCSFHCLKICIYMQRQARHLGVNASKKLKKGQRRSEQNINIQLSKIKKKISIHYVYYLPLFRAIGTALKK